MSAHAQQWSRGRAELWTRSSSAVGWPRVQTSILIVAEAFLRRSSPVGTVLGDSSRQSVFRPEPGRGHLGESPRGGGEFSAACNHTSMQGERKWCSLAKDPAPPLPPPRLLRTARDIDPCVLNPSALPFSKVHFEKRIYGRRGRNGAGVTCHLQGREGRAGLERTGSCPGSLVRFYGPT